MKKSYITEIGLFGIIFVFLFIGSMTLSTALNPNKASLFSKLGFTSVLNIKPEPNGMARVTFNNYGLNQEAQTVPQGKAAGSSQPAQINNLGTSANLSLSDKFKGVR